MRLQPMKVIEMLQVVTRTQLAVVIKMLSHYLEELQIPLFFKVVVLLSQRSKEENQNVQGIMNIPQ
jgi:hypothetical protein